MSDAPSSNEHATEADEPTVFEPRQRATNVPEARALTVARVRDLRSLLTKYIQRHLPPLRDRPSPPPEPPRSVGAYARALALLQTVPWLLGLLFAFSFVWDFPGVILSPFGYTLPLDGVLRIVSVSGLIGFFTNWLAITMLFQPRRRRPILGQGVIPAQRDRVIFRLAQTISEELINEDIIKQKIEESQLIPKYRELAMSVTRGVLEDPDFRRDFKKLVADYVEQVIGSEEVRKKIVEFTAQRVEEHAGAGLGGLALKAYRFFNEDEFQQRIDRAIRDLPDSLDHALDEMDHLLDRIPTMIEARSDDIEDWVTRIVLGFVEKLDIYTMVITNMQQYDERQLERLLKRTTNEQLNYIKYLGGVLGFFGGLIIWQPLLALGVFGALGLVLYAIDEILFRKSETADTRT